MNKTILVVAAHADDEVLGCGGAIARHVHDGDSVFLVFMADGVSSRVSANSDDVNRRMSAMHLARSILGVTDAFLLGFPDNQMDALPLLDIVRALEVVVERIRPDVVYTHHYGDLNIDHRLTQQAVMTACRPVVGSSVREIYGFEVLSSTEWSNPCVDPFVPVHFVDISNFLAVKIDALNAYLYEMRPAPHSRSVSHVDVLARHRGFSVGLDAAEAFSVYRFVR